jgi:hypothetical protein
MKRILTIALLIAGPTLASVTRVSAQETEVVAKVPFAFVVENRTLPAGNYRIEPQGDFLLIENLDGKGSVFATAFQSDMTADGTADLYFHVVNGERYLNRIASTSAKTSLELPVCKAEKKSELLASNKTTEVIHVARGR